MTSVSEGGLPLARELTALRGLQNDKWRCYGDDVLPAFVAEMDFAVAQPVQAVLQQRVTRQDFGYPLSGGRDSRSLLAEACATRMNQRFGWAPDPALIATMGDLVQGLYSAVLAFSNPGDGVIVLMPSYPKIREAVSANQRRLLPLTLRDDGVQFGFDPQQLETLAVGARMLILCNPHNPSGRVFSRAELTMIGECALRHDLVVVSDEIHADLCYPGQTHMPFAALDPTFAARTLTLTSASKSFNLPGLRCAFGVFGSLDLLRRFTCRIPLRVLGDPNAFGMDATLAAWSQGQTWLNAVLAQLLCSRDHLMRRLAAELPQVVIRAPQATYLAWLDCSALALGRPAGEFFLEHAKVAFSPGSAFIDGGDNFLRLNFATAPDLLDEIIDRLIQAARA